MYINYILHIFNADLSLKMTQLMHSFLYFSHCAAATVYRLKFPKCHRANLAETEIIKFECYNPEVIIHKVII